MAGHSYPSIPICQLIPVVDICFFNIHRLNQWVILQLCWMDLSFNFWEKAQSGEINIWITTMFTSSVMTMLQEPWWLLNFSVYSISLTRVRPSCGMLIRYFTRIPLAGIIFRGRYDQELTYLTNWQRWDLNQYLMARTLTF